MPLALWNPSSRQGPAPDGLTLHELGLLHIMGVVEAMGGMHRWLCMRPHSAALPCHTQPVESSMST